MANTSPRGRFVWHELLTTNKPSAIDFYTKVVGWTTQSWPNDPAYTMWTAPGGTPVGGIMLLPDEAEEDQAPPNWLSYVGVDEVDGTHQRALALGAASYVEPREVPGAGHFAVLADPQGAMFAIYKSTQPFGMSAESALGEFSWHELATTDVDAAYEFYRGLFGWEKTDAMDMGDGHVYQMFGFGQIPLGGMYDLSHMQAAAKSAAPPPPNWLPYAMVRNVDDAVGTIKRLDGKIVAGPMDVPGGDRIVVGIDRQGAVFALHAKAAAPARPVPSAKPVQPAAKKPAKKAAKKTAKKPGKKTAKKKTAKKKTAKKKAAKATKRATRATKKKRR